MRLQAPCPDRCQLSKQCLSFLKQRFLLSLQTCQLLRELILVRGRSRRFLVDVNPLLMVVYLPIVVACLGLQCLRCGGRLLSRRRAIRGRLRQRRGRSLYRDCLTLGVGCALTG